MPRDTELDRLKVASDRAYQRKKDANVALQAAWEHKVAAKNEHDRAFDVKQRALVPQNQAWERCDSLQKMYGPRIDSLSAQQESAFQNMRRSFDSASSSYSFGDKASAKSYSEAGHGYKAEAQRCTAERRLLIDELKTAQAQLTAAQGPYGYAKQAFDRAKEAFDRAKAEHASKQAEYERVRAEHEAAQAAFQSRLAIVRANNERRRNDKRATAQRAGVPFAYLDNVWVSTDAEGNTNVYFGGAGKPNGPGHGHYVMNRAGEVTYKRDPYDPHGAQNFEENRREELSRQMARTAMDRYAREQTGPYRVQFKDGDFTVKVKAGYDRRHDSIVSDFIVIDRQNKKEHLHIVYDDHGNELFREWRPNH